MQANFRARDRAKPSKVCDGRSLSTIIVLGDLQRRERRQRERRHRSLQPRRAESATKNVHIRLGLRPKVGDRQPTPPHPNVAFSSSQSELYYESFRDLVDSVLAGFNATIFAYGQTGTGKT